jgi:hypothetical protein
MGFDLRQLVDYSDVVRSPHRPPARRRCAPWALARMQTGAGSANRSAAVRLSRGLFLRSSLLVGRQAPHRTPHAPLGDRRIAGPMIGAQKESRRGVRTHRPQPAAGEECTRLLRKSRIPARTHAVALTLYWSHSGPAFKAPPVNTSICSCRSSGGFLPQP